MQTKNFFQVMSDGAEIAVNRWSPDEGSEIKGVIQLSHGMLEHSLRYDRLGSILAEGGWVFSAHDHRGHGRTAQNAVNKGAGMFGKLADRDGFRRVTQDLDEVIGRLKEEYPGRKVFLLGHSFGSFVAQAYIENHGDALDGCVLCGTAGPQNAAVRLGKAVTDLFRAFLGGDRRSATVRRLIFGSYLDRIPDAQTEYDWLSSNRESVELYLSDSWCGGIPTLSFFHDILSGLLQIHRKDAMRRIPARLPVLMLAGEDDPVGGYGRSVKALCDIYRQNGMRSVELKLYPGARHELFNETDSDTVVSDMTAWLEKTAAAS